MARPAYLRNLTHRVLWVVTPAGTVALGVYWLALRDPSVDWRVMVMGLLLSVSLGWWPAIASGAGFVLAALAWIISPEQGITGAQLAQEVLAFTALGLGWGLLLRSLLKPARNLPPALRHPDPQRFEPPPSFGASRGPEGQRATPTAAPQVAPALAPVPASVPLRPAAPPAMAVPAPAAAPAPVHQDPPNEPLRQSTSPEPSTDDGILLPRLGENHPAPAALPQRPQANPSLSPPSMGGSRSLIQPIGEPLSEMSPFVPQAAPLMTQEVDLGDFRAFVASQQNNHGDHTELPTNRIARGDEVPAQPPSVPQAHSSAGISSSDEPSSVIAPEGGMHRRSQAILRPETVPGAPFEAILEWYNQFSWAPWKPEELEKRYYRAGQKVGWDVLALQDLVRAWKMWRDGLNPTVTSSGYTNLHDLEGFLRCETLGVLRSKGHPDINALSREERSEAWMAVYRETRGRARGGSPVLRPMPDNLVAFDPDHALSGRPDALVEIGGECDVVAFVTPMSAGETMAWTGVYAEAQRELASRLGVVVTDTPIVVTLCMSVWDERRQPRLNEMTDKSTDSRRLGVALERFRKVLDGGQQARPQAHGSVCNGCGARHYCPSYSGTRPRLDLSEPPAILRKFLQ